MMNAVRAIAAACLFTILASAASVAFADELEALPSLKSLPKGYEKISQVIPLLGEHYGKGPVGTMPYGPIYCGYKGKIICVEWILSPADFAAGKTWKDLDGIAGMKLPAPDHIDMIYEANGHGDWPIPLYSLRSYFVSNAFLAKVN
jgi:hypothetical protein